MNQGNEENLPEAVVDETSEDCGDVHVKQDGYRHVMFGQIADGLIPSHTGSPESTDDELCQAAMSDPDAIEIEEPQTPPTPWRVIFIMTIVAISLAIVFWKK